MRSTLPFCLAIAALVLIPSFGRADVTANLDEDFFFVVHGNGEELMGIEIKSDFGGLIPAESADPFNFLLSNTSEQIVYANLPNGLILDGSVTLNAGWDPVVADHGVIMNWGDNATSRPVFLELGPCEDNCPDLRALVNADKRIELRGVGQQLTDLTFRSASGSLVPTDSATPFSQSPVNTSREVTLASSGSSVTIDGAVTLGIGWSDHVFTRDIEYQYQELEGDTVGPISIATRNYAYQMPRLSKIDVLVNEDDHFVVQGESQPITGVQLTSSTGSLIPSEETLPFGTYTSNTMEDVSIRFAGPIVLDGEVVLPTKWDWRKPKEVTAKFDLLGELDDQQLRLPSSKYPQVPEHGKEPLLITLDENNNFVITGIGQEIGGVEFTSTTGAIRVSNEEAVAPFPIRLSNTPELVTVGVLGGVILDGSFVMDFGPVSADRLDEINIQVGFGSRAIDNPANLNCARCDFPSVSISQEGGLVLSGIPDLVTELTFTSIHGGLQGFDAIPEELTLLSASDTKVVIGSDTGFAPEAVQGLQVLWGANFDSQVFVSFTYQNGTSFGPLPIASARAVPEPCGMLLWLSAVCGSLGFRHRRE